MKEPDGFVKREVVIADSRGKKWTVHTAVDSRAEDEIGVRLLRPAFPGVMDPEKLIAAIHVVAGSGGHE